MMITTAQGTASTPSTAASVLTTARWLFRRLLVIFAWFSSMVLLVAVFIAPPVLARFQQDLNFSVWESFSGNAPAWFLFALGISCVLYLPILVSQGVTRTNHARATALALAAISLVVVVLVIAGYAGEALIYERLSMTPTLRSVHAFTKVSQVHLVAFEYWTQAMLFGLVGMLTGYTYYRFNGWLATALLPLSTILPLGVGITLLSLLPVSSILTFGTNVTLPTMDLSALSATWGWGPHAATTIGVALLLLFEVVLFLVSAKAATYMAVRSKAT